MTNKRTTVKEDIAAAMLFSLLEGDSEAVEHIDKLISIVLMQQKAIDVLMIELNLRS